MSQWEVGPCPFCDLLERAQLLVDGELAASFLDSYPLNPGHCLVVPRRHTVDFWDLAPQELGELFAVLAETRALIDERFAPDGYNLGVNVGLAAGQTVPHVHLHLIPRYLGDHPDPRGGVRWILPERAVYWEPKLPPSGEHSPQPGPSHPADPGSAHSEAES